MRGILAISLVALGALANVTAQAQVDAAADARLTEKCLTETEGPALRDCVVALKKIADVRRGMFDALLEVVRECSKERSMESARVCLGPTVLGEEMRPTLTPPEKPQRTWEVIKGASRMDNSPTVVLRLESDIQIRAWGTEDRPVLLLRCRENTTAVLFVASWFLGDAVPVQWRADNDKAVMQTWERSDDRKAAGLWEGGRAIPFIKGLFGKSTLVARVTPFSEAPKEMSFNIAGLDSAIAPLREACKW